MLLCKVARGNIFKTENNMDTLQGAAPEGYDSVHGDAQNGGALNYDELVVYKEEAVLPYAIVEYSFTKLAMSVERFLVAHNESMPHHNSDRCLEIRTRNLFMQIIFVGLITTLIVVKGGTRSICVPILHPQRILNLPFWLKGANLNSP